MNGIEDIVFDKSERNVFYAVGSKSENFDEDNADNYN